MFSKINTFNDLTIESNIFVRAQLLSNEDYVLFLSYEFLHHVLYYDVT